MPDNNALREDVLWLLRGGRAHVSFEAAVANLPEAFRGKKPRRAPYTPWQQLEHMRIAQWDILEYIRNPKHLSPEWPAGYWPGGGAAEADYVGPECEGFPGGPPSAAGPGGRPAYGPAGAGPSRS